MREIKFRAWDKNGSYTDGTPGMIEDITGRASFGHIWYDDDFIKMQYTGLKDSNGAEIYEGDLFTYEHWTGVIKYRGCGFYIEWLPPVQWGLSNKLENLCSYGEVVGNIHQSEVTA